MKRINYRSLIEKVRIADSDESIRRINICKQCEHFKDPRCTKCGCFMFVKTKLQSARCPIGLWGVFDKE